VSITCDRCGREMNNYWMIPGAEIKGSPIELACGAGVGGNCPICGDNLCADCAGEWGEAEGECQRCREESYRVAGSAVNLAK